MGGDWGGIGLSIMTYIDHNCMKRCDSREMCVASLSSTPVNLPKHTAGWTGCNRYVQALDFGAGFGDGGFRTLIIAT